MRAICKTESVDIQGLHSMIDEYKYRHNGENPSYLIMNYLSITNISDQIIITKKTIAGNSKYDLVTRRYETLFGIPVAINEELKFGEVDII